MSAPSRPTSRRPRLSRASFTLIEIIVVIVVLGILAAIAIVGYRAVIDRSEWASLETTAETIDREYRAVLAFNEAGLLPVEIAAEVLADLPSAAAPGVFANPTSPPGSPVTATFVPAAEALSGEDSIEATRYGKFVCLDLADDAEEPLGNRVMRGDCASASPSGPEDPQEPGDVEGEFPLTATGGNHQIVLDFEDRGAASYTGRCWTAAMGESNAVSAVSSSNQVTVTGLENYVQHTCRVSYPGSTSDPADATPVGVPEFPPTVPGVPELPPGSVVGVEPEPEGCAVECDILEHPHEVGDPIGENGGVWDVSSLYSVHSGAHRLYAIDRDRDRVFTVVDDGTVHSSVEALVFRTPDNASQVTFDDPTGISYGAHPSRSPAASTTLFSGLYLTDAGSGTVFYLDVFAHRAYPVATGFDEPMSAVWAPCYDKTTGAPTTVLGVDECVYVADSDGVWRVPLMSDVDANSSTNPTAVAKATLEVDTSANRFSTVAARKLHVSDDGLISTESNTVVSRPFTVAVTTLATYTPPAGPEMTGVTTVPAAVSGLADDLVVVTAGHRILWWPASSAFPAGLESSGDVNPGPLSNDATWWETEMFDSPRAVHFHGNSPYVYVADTGNSAVRRVDLTTGDATFVYGGGGTTAPPAAPDHPGLRSRGFNTDNLIGDGTSISRLSFTDPDWSGALAGRQIVQSDMGGVHCGVDLEGAVFCWGKRTGEYSNNAGENALGDGNNTGAAASPVAVDMSGVMDGKTAVKVVVGGRHACALTTSNEIFCWGNNEYGQLGNNVNLALSASQKNTKVPVAVDMSGALAGKTVTDIDAIGNRTCALADGGLFCWGSGGGGALGTGNTSASPVPTSPDMSGVLAGTTITDVGMGSNVTCVVADGAPYCWGGGGVVQPVLGDGTIGSSNVPVAVDMSGVLAGKTVTEVAVSGDSGTKCALADDRLFCWGNGGNYLSRAMTEGLALSPRVEYAPSGVFGGTDFQPYDLQMSTTTGCFRNHPTSGFPERLYCWGMISATSPTSTFTPTLMSTPSVLTGYTLGSGVGGTGPTMAVTYQ